MYGIMLKYKIPMQTLKPLTLLAHIIIVTPVKEYKSYHHRIFK